MDNPIEIECIIEGLDGLWSIRYDVEHTPAVAGNRSGHPDNWTEDEPEEFEFSNIQIEMANDSFSDVSDKDAEAIIKILEEMVKEI